MEDGTLHTPSDTDTVTHTTTMVRDPMAQPFNSSVIVTSREKMGLREGKNSREKKNSRESTNSLVLEENDHLIERKPKDFQSKATQQTSMEVTAKEVILWLMVMVITSMVHMVHTIEIMVVSTTIKISSSVKH